MCYFGFEFIGKESIYQFAKHIKHRRATYYVSPAYAIISLQPLQNRPTDHVTSEYAEESN
jgi:hypothetical protein